MKIRPIIVNFAETAEDEAQQLWAEIRLKNILEALEKGESLKSSNLEDIRTLLYCVADLFDHNLPAIDNNPLITLQRCSRDLKLSLLLRERGLFRFYRLLIQKNQKGIPLYMTFSSPEDGTPFKNQAEFVRWFSKEAHVPYSLIFTRKKAIQRLLSLDLTLEDSFRICISKPQAVYDILEWVGEWDDENQLVDINPDIAVRMTEKISPDHLDEIEELADAVRSNPADLDVADALCQAYKPVVVDLLEDVAAHPSATDVKNFVRHDVLEKPEIYYRIDPVTKAILIDYVQKEIDPNGMEYTTGTITYTYAPQTYLEVPSQIIQDLSRRLPIKNRSSLDDLL